MGGTASCLLPGTQLGELRIERTLGAGAFGVTYQAQDTYLGIAVALKEYFPSEYARRLPGGNVEPWTEPGSEMYAWGLDRFIGEAQVLAQFKHPNIVRVSRYFEANGTAYIVMDYEEGQSLSSYLPDLPVPPPEATLREIFLPVLEGLREVHNKRYLHGDIKPGNIYIRRNGTPILLDFGSAKLDLAGPRDEGTSLFTPGYAPPEQYDSAQTQGPHSDIYSVGATLYRCLAGKTPASAMARLRAREAGEQDPLLAATVLAAGRVSAPLLETVDRMLCLDPSQRPPGVGDVLRALLDAGDGESTTVVLTRRRPMVQHKIVITGPVGAGKTTAVASLSDDPVVSTDARASDMAGERKATTTVAMDYGVMQLDAGERVHLYGTPGQERFDFMWEILQRGGLGLVVLVDNTRRDPMRDLDFFLHAFPSFVEQGRVAVGITRTDLAPSPGVADYHRHLRDHAPGVGLNLPIFQVDARCRRDVAMLVQALLYTIDPGVEDYDV